MTNYPQKNIKAEQKWYLTDCKKEIIHCRNKRKSLYLQCVICNVSYYETENLFSDNHSLWVDFCR